MELPLSSTLPGTASAESTDDREKGVVAFPVDPGAGNGHLTVDFVEHPLYPLLLDHSYPEAAEHFAVLRSRVLSATGKSKFATLLITSPGRAEGKSMITMNLAISFGRLGTPRVLLVDCDLRVSTVSQLLQIEDKPGVSEYLQGTRRFEEIIQPTVFPSVSVLPAGRTPDELLPAILEGPQWAQLLSVAKERFDLILVDSVPAAAPIADCELTAAACDAALLVVHLGKTQREALANVKKHLGRKLAGIIINNIDRRVGSDYYAYYRAKK